MRLHTSDDTIALYQGNRKDAGGVGWGGGGALEDQRHGKRKRERDGVRRRRNREEWLDQLGDEEEAAACRPEDSDSVGCLEGA